MSKIKVKGTLDNKTKMASLDRGTLTIQVLEDTFKRLFDVGSVQFKYKMSNGNLQGIYQDFHLENALSDCASSGARFLELQLTSSGAPPATSSPVKTPTASPVAPKPTPVQSSPSPSGGSSIPSPSNKKLMAALGPDPDPPKPSSGGGPFCTNCGVNVKGVKFCPECGTPAASSSSPSVPRSTVSPVASTPTPKPVPSSGGCAACGGAIGLTSVSAMNTNWHKECFVCQSCKKSLLECGFKGVNNLPMCGPCYNDRFGLKCSACKRTIDSEYVQVAGQPFHRECYA